MTDYKIGVVGCAGRMGSNLLRVIHERAGCVIGGGSERPGHEVIGQDIGALINADELGIAVVDNPEALFDSCDCVIDFTVPAATVAHAKLAAASNTVHVIGTTGMTAQEDAAIAEAAKSAPIMQAANFCLGVNLALQLTQQTAAILGPDWDIEVLEMHHKHKVDAPSGTALALGKAAAAGRGVEHDAVADRGRDGITGARKEGDIGYAVLRGGSVAGEHSVIFATEDERIEITHKATDRIIFARGAVHAALWMQDKPAGFYDMRDVLGFKD